MSTVSTNGYAIPSVPIDGTTVPPPPDRKRVPLTQFHADATLRAADTDQRTFVRTAMSNYMGVREETQSLFADYPAARTQAAAVKWEALNNLEALLLEFEKNAMARGTHVHWAADGASVCNHVIEIMRGIGATKVIKSKSMATEEVHLNHALHEAGIEAIESDLGEFILHLRDEGPYHFVFPSMHLRRGEIKDIFSKYYEGLTADDPETLTLFAREILRLKYLQADVGISGGNFGVADSGAIAITENEGNARLTCSLPKVHIVVMGIEKIIPKLEDLALMQPMLGTAGAGQLLTGYNSVYFGPRVEGEAMAPSRCISSC